MKKFKPTKFDVMVLGLTALFLLVTGLYFVVSNGALLPLCQDYFISNGETYIWDTRGGYLEPLSVYRHCHSDGVSMLDIKTGMHSECSSTARTGIVRFADDPGPPSSLLPPPQAGPISGPLPDAGPEPGLHGRLGAPGRGAVQAEDCFLTLTWDGEWDQWEIHITW